MAGRILDGIQERFDSAREGLKDLIGLGAGEQQQVEEVASDFTQKIIDEVGNLKGVKVGSLKYISVIEHIADNAKRMRGGKQAAISLIRSILMDIKGGPYQYGLNFASAVTSSIDSAEPAIFALAQFLGEKAELMLLERAGGSSKVLIVLRGVLRQLRHPEAPVRLRPPEPEVRTPPPPPPVACDGVEVSSPQPTMPAGAPDLFDCAGCEDIRQEQTDLEAQLAPVEEELAEVERKARRNKADQRQLEREVQTLETGLKAERGIGAESFDPGTGIRIRSEDMGNGQVQITTTYPDGRVETRTRERRSSRRESRALREAKNSLEALKKEQTLYQRKINVLSESLSALSEKIARRAREYADCSQRCRRGTRPVAEGEGIHLFPDSLIQRYKVAAGELTAACDDCQTATDKVNLKINDLKRHSIELRGQLESFNRLMRRARAVLSRESTVVSFATGTRSEAFFCRNFPPAQARRYLAMIEAGKFYRGGATTYSASVETRKSPALMASVREDQARAAEILSEIYPMMRRHNALETELSRAERELRACEQEKCGRDFGLHSYVDVLDPPTRERSPRFECEKCAKTSRTYQSVSQRLLNARRKLYDLAVNRTQEIEQELAKEDLSPERIRILKDKLQDLRTRTIAAQIRVVRNRTLEDQAAWDAMQACNETCKDEEEEGVVRARVTPDEVKKILNRFGLSPLDPGREPAWLDDFENQSLSGLAGAVKLSEQSRWEAVKRSLRRVVLPYVRQDPTLLDRALSPEFLQDRNILMNGIRRDFQEQTSINLELQLLTYRFTDSLAIVEVRWQRSATVQSTGLVQVLQGNATLLFDRFHDYLLKALFGASFVGVTDPTWQTQAQVGDPSSAQVQVLFEGGSAPAQPTNPGGGTTGPTLGGTQSSGTLRVADANFGPNGVPNHIAINLSGGTARTFLRGSGPGTCSPGTCSQAGDDLILSPNFVQGTILAGGGSFFALEGQGDGGSGPNAQLFDCGFSSLGQESGINTQNPQAQVFRSAGPAAYTYVLGVRSTGGLFHLVQVQVNELQGQQVGDVTVQWTSPGSFVPTGFGPGTNPPCGN